jgi:hypothetical protein
MPKPNNPYQRPINATKESAMPVAEFYGTKRGARATDKAINHAAGNRNVSPASRYQAVGHSNAPTTPTPDVTSPSKAKSKRGKVAPAAPTTAPSTSDVGKAVTAEDLFGW